MININIDEVQSIPLANSIYCRHDLLLFTYLGMPLGCNPKRFSTWKPIILMFRNKLLCGEENFFVWPEEYA